MADRDYAIKIDLQGASQAVSAITQVTTALISMDAAAVRARKSFAAFSKAAAGMGQVTTQAKGLASQLSAVTAAATQTGASLKSVAADLKVVQKATTATTSAGSGYVKMMGGFLAATTAISVARGIFSDIADEMKKVSDYAKDTAEKNRELLDTFRELRNLRGDATTEETANANFKFRMETGMKDAEAREFQEQFRGSIESAKDKGNLRPGGKKDATPEELSAFQDELAQTAAKIGMSYGMDAKTAGDFSAVIGQYRPITSKEELAGEFAGFSNSMNAGRGKVSALTKAGMGKIASLVGNGVEDMSQFGALMSVATTVTGSPGSAATLLNQMHRAVNPSPGPARDTLDKLGVSGIKGDVEKLRALAPHILGAADPTKFMTDSGWGNLQDRDAMLKLVSNGNIGVIDRRTARGRATTGMGAAEIGKANTWMGQDPAMQNRLDQVRLDTADYLRGKQMQTLDAGVRNATAAMLNPGQPGGPQLKTPATAKNDALAGWANMLTSDYWMNADFPTPEEQRIHFRAANKLIYEGTQVGIDVEAKYPGLGTGKLGKFKMAEAFNEFGPPIEGKGGDPYGRKTEALTTALDNLTATIKQQNRPRAGGGLPGLGGGNAGNANVPKRGNGP